MKAPTPAKSSNLYQDEDAIAFVRVVFAASFLVVTYFSTPRLFIQVSLLSLALTLYCLYSILHCLPGESKYYQLLRHHAHWVDVGWFGLFLMLGSGTGLGFFPGFFFATLVASIRRGSKTGLQVALVSLILISADRIYEVSLGTQPAGAISADTNPFILHSIFLLLLGFLMFCRGNFEMLFRRRLLLIKDVMTLSNPRFGVDRTIGAVMERVRAFYDANTCVLIMAERGQSTYGLRRAVRSDPEKAMSAEEIPDHLARQLLVIPDTHAVLYDAARKWLGQNKIYEVPYPDSAGREDEVVERYDELAAMLSARSFVTIPVIFNDEVMGRLYVTAQRRFAFTRSDTDFLAQIIQHVLPVIENIRLVDRLASDAAEHERQRIARDIHDSVIQPYIGIQMGLGAVRKKLERGSVNVDRDLERLMEMTQLEIHGLRRYVGGLSQAKDQQVCLLQAVKSFTEKFTDATGIFVDVKVESEMRVNDRLSAEVFQLVAEGLSNIRRHTHSSRGVITMTRQQEHFQLCIGNESNGGGAAQSFIPKSITARAASLGGRVQVENAGDGWTRLKIEIPL
jgi:signal transduction histidine kinase